MRGSKPLPMKEIASGYRPRYDMKRIEREHIIVEGNRELIRLFEEKVKKVNERAFVLLCILRANISIPTAFT